MLTSFGCEQIVQVRATEQLQERRTCRAPVEIYSGTRQPSATAKKGPSIRGDNVELSGCSRQALSGLAFAPRAPRAVMALLLPSWPFAKGVYNC